MRFLLFLFCLNYVSAFMLNRIGNSLSAQFTPLRTGVLYAPARRTFLQSNPVQVEVFARDFDLTDAIQERVDKKIGKVVGKLGQDAISAHVVLRLHKQHMNEKHSQMNKPHQQIAEATITFKGGGVLHASERSDSMYATIDILSHRLATALKRHHNKMRDKRRKQRTNASAAAADLEELEAMLPDFDEDSLLDDLEPSFQQNIKPFVSMSKMGVVRPKYFPMPPISVDDALHNFDLIDHPFYVFRNQESNEINVLYRRRSGGVGLIMPGK